MYKDEYHYNSKSATRNFIFAKIIMKIDGYNRDSQWCIMLDTITMIFHNLKVQQGMSFLLISLLELMYTAWTVKGVYNAHYNYNGLS